MGLGKKLTQNDQGRVDALVKIGRTARDIAKEIGRSHTARYNYMKDPMKYNRKIPGGRPQKLTKHDKLRVKRAIRSQPGVTCPHLVRDLTINVSPDAVHRFLKSSKMTYQKRQPVPLLSKAHKIRRIEFIKNSMATDWEKVVFSDEKSFNLDGPNGCQLYWHDPSFPKEVFSTRKFKGGGVSVWAAISVKGGVAFHVYEKAFKAEQHITWLQQTGVFESARELLGDDFTFQQDNAAQHNAAATRQYLESQNIHVMDSPSRSPDLNPIENVWAVMVRRLYASGNQFKTKKELEMGIWKVWEELDSNTLKTLYGSMKDRIAKVLLKPGSFVGY